MSETAIKLQISKIRRDGGTQPRVAMNQDTITTYCTDIRDGVILPPVKVVYDGTNYWLVDGFHRVSGAEAAFKDEVYAEVGVAETKAIELLNAVLHKRSATHATANAQTLTEAIDALTQGKFDKALGLTAAAPAATAPEPTTAPANQAAPTPPAAEDPILAELASIENWEQFQEIAAGIAQAKGVNDVAFANGLDLATGKINRKGKESSISRITLRSWAAAMHLGTFDWNTGTVIAKK